MVDVADHLVAMLDVLEIRLVGLVDGAEPLGDLAVAPVDPQRAAADLQVAALQRRLDVAPPVAAPPPRPDDRSFQGRSLPIRGAL